MRMILHRGDADVDGDYLDFYVIYVEYSVILSNVLDS